MHISLSATKGSTPEAILKQHSGALVIGIMPKGLGRLAKAVDGASGGVIGKLRNRGDIKGNVGETLVVPTLTGIGAERVLLVGLGAGKTLSDVEFRKVVQAVLGTLADIKVEDASWSLEGIAVTDRDDAWQATQIALAATLREYRYTQTVSKPKPALALRKLALIDSNATKKAVATGIAIGKGMNAARHLGDLPGNFCTPTTLATEARALGRRSQQLKVSVLEEKAMRELGMGSLLSVSAGSQEPAKLIVMQYHGGKKGEQPQVLVGKGITFDSGGISIKPAGKMDEMKYDMCGAASVIGTMTALIELQLPINVIGVIAAAENMPSGGATKPGDVVKSMSGQTIEILNTDAEGRLVLCDALTYVARFKPAAVIDIATLTGACVVALGGHASGLFSNQDDFAQELLDAGRAVGDRAWQLPLWDDYQKGLDTNFADMANVAGPGGGAIVAACFLARFTKEYRWAHLDIAGTAWLEGAAKGATGRPVGLLTQYLLNVAGR